MIKLILLQLRWCCSCAISRKFKNNQVTVEKQKKLTCIRDVMYIMNTYDLTMYASSKPRAAEVVDDAGLAFQESQSWTTVTKKDCYCCGKELGRDGHPNSWHKCGNVNGAKKSEVAKKFAEGFFNKSYKAPKKKGNDATPAAIHVNVEEPPADEEEKAPAPGSLGKWHGTTKELYKATWYTMSEIGAVEEDTSRDAGDWDTVKEFGVACPTIKLLNNEWRTPICNGRKPTTKQKPMVKTGTDENKQADKPPPSTDAAWMAPVCKSALRTSGTAKCSRGRNIPSVTPQGRPQAKEEMDSLVEKGVFKAVRSEGVPKRKVRRPKRVHFVRTENEAPEEAPSAPEMTPEEPKTVAPWPRHTVNG